MSEQHRHNLKKGIYYILLAWACWSVAALLVREISPRVSTWVSLFALNLVGLILTIPVLMKSGWHDLLTNRIGLLIFRAVLGLFGFAFLFLAITKISLTNALLLNNCAPLLLPLVLRVWLKIKIDARLWISMVVGFAGICLMLKPTQTMADLGAFYGVLAALCLALAMVSVRLLSYTEKHHSILFYFFAIDTLLLLPVAIILWKPVAFIDFAAMIAIGILGFLGHLCFIKAFHFAKASHLGPFNYVVVIYGALMDAIFFKTFPGLITILGAILIIIGGILSIHFTKTPSTHPPQ
jgi:drug/metabolite transporter (DMT)-like permease